MDIKGSDIMPYPHFAPIPPFIEFTPTTWVIPKMYWDAFSPEQRYHTICRMLCKIIAYCDQLGIKTDELGELYQQLADDFEAFKEHGFDDYYLDQIEKWVNDNLETLYHLLVKQVYFGLTLDGHFVAYIPESWEDIEFDTGYDYSLDTYGRLILRWAVDGSEVDQRPEANQYGVIGG